MLWAQGTKMHIVIYADNWSTGQFKFLARTSLDIEKGTFIGHLNAIYPGPYFLNALVFLKKLRKELKLNNGLVSLYANNDYPCDFEFQHGNDSYHIYIAPRRNPIDYLSDLEKSYKSIKWHIENKGEMLEVPNHV